MTSTSASRSSGEAPAWLQAVYAARHRRTVDLVGRSIAALSRAGQRISLAALTAASKQVDPTGKGVSESAILHNEAARAQYEHHRSWRSARRGPGPRRGQPTTDGRAPERVSPVSKPDRDRTRAHRRYMRLAKPELVERLLVAEQACAEARDRWLRMNGDLLTWMHLVGWLLAQEPQGHGTSPPYEPPFLTEPNAAED